MLIEANDAMLHRIVDGVLGTLVTAVGAVLWRFFVDQTKFKERYEERHAALKGRVEVLETSVGEIPAAMNRMGEVLRTQIERLSDSIERSAEKTNGDIGKMREDIAFIRGQAQGRSGTK